MEIGDYLRENRKKRRLTLKELAAKIDISFTYLSQIERGDRKPSKEILSQLSEQLNLAYPTLLEKAGYTHKPNDIEMLEVHLYALNNTKQHLGVDLDMLKRAIWETESEYNDLDLMKKNIIGSTINEELNKLKKEYEKTQNTFDSIDKQIEIIEKSIQDIKNTGDHSNDERYSEYIQYLNKQFASAIETSIIHLNENNEGDFIFYKEGQPLSQDLQDKLKSLIKITLS